MEIIDNVNRLLGDDLRDTIRPGSKVRIAEVRMDQARPDCEL